MRIWPTIFLVKIVSETQDEFCNVPSVERQIRSQVMAAHT